MTQELLHRPDVVAVLEQMRGEAVAESVAAYRLLECGRVRGRRNRALYGLRIQMMANVFLVYESRHRCFAGNMYCQPHEVDASGYLRANA